VMDRYSVLMSLYIKENPSNLKASLDSMLQQTVPPDEIVMVVDGPLTPELNAVLDYYQQAYPLIKKVTCTENVGLGKALNLGLNHCQNELIARMDTDDISVNDRCERQLAEFRKNPSLSIVGGAIAEFIDEPENVVGYRTVPSKDVSIKDFMKKRCAFNHVTVMFRKSDVLRAGNYQHWFYNEDYFLWIRMQLAGCTFGNIPDTLVKVRITNDTYKRRGGYKYFISEVALQKFMLDNRMIGIGRFFWNTGVRVILQLLLPSRFRGFVMRRFARRTSPRY
jgi:glycosyltransferase involved in cell wall biosynthesis